MLARSLLSSFSMNAPTGPARSPVPPVESESLPPAQLPRSQDLAFGIGACIVGVAAFVALLPMWLPVTLASWCAHLTRPLATWLEKRWNGRQSAAAVVTVLMVLVVLLPLAFVVLSLTGEVIRLFSEVSRSGNLQAALQGAMGDDSPSLSHLSPSRLFQLAREHGSQAFRLASQVLGVTASAMIGLVVFTMGVYAFLTRGGAIREWILEHAPLPRAYTERFIGAFHETGGGLLIGTGLTCFIQGAVAAVGYLVAGVPQPFVFGLLTAIAGLVPGLGTGLVWAPVTVVLFLSGEQGAAVIVASVGCFISVADNFIRPALSRWGKLDLPTYLVFLSMLGGIAVFGTSGLLAGPLLVRWAIEALRIASERKKQIVAPNEIIV